jgi:hypothetical protein
MRVHATRKGFYGPFPAAGVIDLPRSALIKRRHCDAVALKARRKRGGHAIFH